MPIPVAGGFIAALVHFSPLPLIYFGPERARIYSGLLMVLVGMLSLMMVSTLRFSSFKTVGTKVRSMRTIILALSIGMLVFLYSRYVLLALVVSYVLHAIISRVVSMFWRRHEAAEGKIEPNPVGRES
jgi:CDP-diacylglycerol--serine O-phosphatidyltransferase